MRFAGENQKGTNCFELYEVYLGGLLMLGSGEIRNVRFSKAVGGYKPEEVNRLLDKIVEDYEEFENRTKKFQSKIEEMKVELEQLKKEKSSINNVLVSAQQLADKTIQDAKEQAEKLSIEASAEIEKIKAEFDNEKQNLENEKQEFIASTEAEKQQIKEDFERFSQETKDKQEAMLVACKEAVNKEQLLFEKIKISVAEFKKQVLTMYSAHTAEISAIPDEITEDPQTLAEAIALNFNKEAESLETEVCEDETATEEPAEELDEVVEEKEPEKNKFFKS